MIKHTWTGGDTPIKSVRRNNRVFRELRIQFFREQVAECGGLNLWDFKDEQGKRGYPGTSPLERARLFWNRATLDAWRTIERNKLV